jgi:predicted short-subunit dehydrogenase-like oxidoreductase (DUF2520 family)
VLDEGEMREKVGIAGTGRVAQALARLLLEEGEAVVCIAGRDPRRTRLAAEFAGQGVEPVPFSQLASRAQRWLIAVSDTALPEVVRLLAGAATRAGIALHTCGTKDEDELLPLRKLGFSCGTLHPLQTISEPLQGVAALWGAAFAVSGDEAAAGWAGQIVERLGGTVLNIPGDARPLYHAAAVMASNYVVALIDAAQGLLSESAGVDRETALRALAPLVRSAVGNVFICGPAAALTGPVERGDAATVGAHLQALAPTAVADFYRAAGLHTLDLARRKGLNAGAAQQIEEVLRGN